MEETKETLIGVVVVFVIKLIVAIVMDFHESEEPIDSEEMILMIEKLEGENNISIECLLERIAGEDVEELEGFTLENCI